MRKENPLFATIYPEGESTCVKCSTTNLLGESFHYHIWKGDHCPDCHKEIEYRKKREQVAQYVSGEDTPDYTSEITCPWCGHEQSDSWESPDSNDNEECGNCNKNYSYERYVEVTYCSSRVEEEEK